MNVYEKLMQVQTQLKAPKGQFNSFGKYKYRSCEDILESLKPLLAEVKAILTLTDEVQQIGERFYIKATATFTDTEKGEKVEVSALAREDENKKGMDLAQVTGSVSSYARKYSLNGLFCIDDTKDSDATNDGSEKPPYKAPTSTLKDKGVNTPPTKTISPTEVVSLTELALEHNISTGSLKATILRDYKKTKIGDLTEAEYLTVKAKMMKI